MTVIQVIWAKGELRWRTADAKFNQHFTSANVFLQECERRGYFDGPDVVVVSYYKMEKGTTKFQVSVYNICLYSFEIHCITMYHRRCQDM